MKGRPRLFVEGRLLTFTLISQGRNIACAVTRDALERHFLCRRESDDATLVSAFERGLRRILEAADRKSRALPCGAPVFFRTAGCLAPQNPIALMVRLPRASCPGKRFGKEFFIRQHHVIFSRQHFARQPFKCVARYRGIGAGAQDQANWRIFARQSPMLARVIAVHMHLAHLGMIKFGELQVDDNETTQAAMKKEKVHPKPALANAKPTLAAYKRKVATELKQKIFEPMDQRVFQFQLSF